MAIPSEPTGRFASIADKYDVVHLRCRISGPLALLACMLASKATATEVTGKIVLEKSAIRKTLGVAVYDMRGMTPRAREIRQEDGPFRRVAVWIEPEGPVSVSPGAGKMRQSGRRFDPDFLVVPVGSKVDFPNLDPIFHNIFSLSRSETFDLGYYSEGKSRSVTFSRPGVVQVYCHIHPGMYGVIVITPTIWSAMPADDGSFGWTGIPPGQYHLDVWQKTAGLVKKRLNVPRSGAVHMTIALPDESDQ
jgi:plastocyanin